MTLYREWLDEQHILGSQELSRRAHGRRVRAAGLLVVHQSPPTAKGFHFLTLEDQDGLMNVIVSPGVYGRYRSVIRGARLLLVAGKVQQEDGVVNLLAEHLARLSGRAFE
ncbi:MAG: hypothetical protein IPM39_10500 [Chloroflexi bacterium]|nr:hypothetical protein [Chloroflexota bacterium]